MGVTSNPNKMKELTKLQKEIDKLKQRVDYLEQRNKQPYQYGGYSPED